MIKSIYIKYYELFYSVIFLLAANSFVFSMNIEIYQNTTCQIYAYNIVDAAYMNDISLFSLLINSSQVDINQKDKYGRTALYYSVLNSNKDMFEKILGFKDIDVNVQDNYGVTPLHVATVIGSVSFVLALLEKGSNSDIEDITGMSARCEAKCLGYTGLTYIFDISSKQ